MKTLGHSLPMLDNSTGVDSFYQVFDENGGVGGRALTTKAQLGNLMCEDNCVLKVDLNAQNAANNVLTIQDNDDSILAQLNTSVTVNNATAFGVTAETNVLGTGSVPVTISEQGPNSGVFGTYDESDKSVLKSLAMQQGEPLHLLITMKHQSTVLVGFDFATIDIQPSDDEWNSGEEIPVVIVDGDANVNSRIDEDLDLFNPDVSLIPSLATGDPFTLGEGSSSLQVVTFNDTIASSRTVGTIGSTALA